MLGEPEHVVEYFQDMLEYVKAAGLTQSYSNKSLCTILDVFAQSRDLGFVHKVYETLLNMLYESRNEVGVLQKHCLQSYTVVMV